MADRNGGVTSHDVARLAGVSQPTVSRALREDPRVSPDTRERVRLAAERLHYVPSAIGRSLSTRSTRRVAMVADLGNPLYPELMGPVHAALERHGYRLVLFAEDENLDEATAYDRLFDQSIDGVVLTTTRLNSTLPAALTRRRIPYVMLNRTIPGAEAVSCVADNVAGARQVGQRFVADGHRRIAGLLGPEQTSTARDRERGFRDALAEAGVALPERYVHRGLVHLRVRVRRHEAAAGGATGPHRRLLRQRPGRGRRHQRGRRARGEGAGRRRRHRLRRPADGELAGLLADHGPGRVRGDEPGGGRAAGRLS